MTMMTLITIMMMMMTMLPDTVCPFVPFPLMGGSADSEGTAGVMLTIITPVTRHTDNVGYWQVQPIILFTFINLFLTVLCQFVDHTSPHYNIITAPWSLVTV